MSEAIIETRNLTKEYMRDEFHVIALKDVSLRDTEGRIRGADGAVGFGQIDAAAPDRCDGSRLPAGKSACWGTTCGS